MMMRIRRLFQRNLPAKIFALLVAVVLWFFVMNDQNPSIDGSFTVPLSVVNAPEGYKISRSDDNIKIKVRGPRSLFVSASASEFKAYVSLEGVEEGRNSIKVQTVLPQGFELVEASPDLVTVTVEKIIQRQVKVELIVTGAAAQGTTVASTADWPFSRQSCTARRTVTSRFSMVQHSFHLPFNAARNSRRSRSPR